MSITLTVKAVVTPATGETVDNTELQVGYFLLSNASFVALASGRVDAKGALTLTCTFDPAGTYQPRLQLRMRRASTAVFTKFSEDPVSYASNIIDFGSLPLPATKPPPAPVVTETTLQNVVQGAGLQVKKAQESLRSSGLQMGKVSFQLKVLPSTTEGNVVVPKVDDLARISRRSLSQVSFEVEPTASAAATEATPFAVPNFVGFTEVLARRKLTDLKLQVDVVYLLVDLDEHIGRVRLQRPAPPATVKAGDVITLGIGRKG